MNPIQIYIDLVALYNKTHTYHIRTIKMKEAFNLYSYLGDMYECVSGLYDRVWEDIIQKKLNKNIPSTNEIMSKTNIGEEIETSDINEYVMDLYDDVEQLLMYVEEAVKSEKDLLIQNILLEIQDKLSGLCADLERLSEDEEDDNEMEDDSETKIKLPK